MAFELNMTEKTPEVLFDSEKGFFKFNGVIYPEDATTFFYPLFKYVEAYFNNACAETTLEIDLEYFNTSASRQLFQLIKLFADMSDKGKSHVKVKWMYEADDPDMLEAGEEYASMFTSLEFELIEIERPKVFELMN